jgi:hypothetical protein
MVETGRWGRRALRPPAAAFLNQVMETAADPGMLAQHRLDPGGGAPTGNEGNDGERP